MNRVRTVFPLKSHSKNPLTATVSADYKSFTLVSGVLCAETLQTLTLYLYKTLHYYICIQNMIYL